MTYLGRETNNRCNDRNGFSKKKLSSNQHLVTNQVNEENGRRNCKPKVSESQSLTKEDNKGTINRVTFDLPRDYPIMSWFVDSGASEHMINSEDYFDESRELEKPTRVVVAKSGVELQATRVGTVRGHSIVNGQRIEYTFRDVLFVPDLQANLFSVAKVANLKLKVIFENSVCKIVKREKEVAIAIREDKLYELKILLHSVYCTHSIRLLRLKKMKQQEKVKSGTQPSPTDNSIVKPTAASIKKNISNIEVKPKQKVFVQEL